ncbi:4-hydroxythreonine-4-phosphate dehydrogenase PdxA [Puniceibacterium sediminis]|uniref:4-hydroxythreonine-4-phosphate dehydrogenase PdxA n=1 Tax=Puniceibacterium sediminis TaxID=1608407 RepID=UPI001FE259FD|nr:4-hydroxythreonine-4-phosphate dehydrogenase PdxA [Puniceibacterium sediminis]
MDLTLGDGPGALRVVHVPVDGLPGRFGVLSDACGEGCFRFIDTALKMSTGGKAAGIVTAPINKEALNSAGHHYDGHTGMLAHLTGCFASWMLLDSDTLNVIHVSTHVSLKDASPTPRPRGWPRRSTSAIGRSSAWVWQTRVSPWPESRLHCGENGLFGREDDLQVLPGAKMAPAEGIDGVGAIGGYGLLSGQPWGFRSGRGPVSRSRAYSEQADRV